MHHSSKLSKRNNTSFYLHTNTSFLLSHKYNNSPHFHTNTSFLTIFTQIPNFHALSDRCYISSNFQKMNHFSTLSQKNAKFLLTFHKCNISPHFHQKCYISPHYHTNTSFLLAFKQMQQFSPLSHKYIIFHTNTNTSFLLIFTQIHHLTPILHKCNNS